VILGDYRLTASLGRGGMSKVFLAIRSGMEGVHKLVVIKRSRTDSLAQPHAAKYRALLLDKAGLAARLRHPNIVQTFEVGAQQGQPFLDGQPLNTVLSKVRHPERWLPSELVLQIVADSLAALSYAHDLADHDGEPLSIVHRDVSPQNIDWTYDGEIKLVDFGVAKFAYSSSETAPGVAKGKLTYTAPEQARGMATDRCADIFVTGIVLWELMSGRRLLRATSQAVSTQRLLFEELPSLSRVKPTLDAAATSQALDAVASSQLMPARAERVRPVSQPLPRQLGSSRRRWLLGLGAVAIAAVAVGIVLLREPRTDAASAAPGRSAPLGTLVALAPPARAHDLRLRGSNTIGAELGPALVEGFLKRKGATAVAQEPEPEHARLATTLLTVATELTAQSGVGPSAANRLMRDAVVPLPAGDYPAAVELCCVAGVCSAHAGSSCEARYTRALPSDGVPMLSLRSDFQRVTSSAADRPTESTPFVERLTWAFDHPLVSRVVDISVLTAHSYRDASGMVMTACAGTINRVFKGASLQAVEFSTVGGTIAGVTEGVVGRTPCKAGDRFIAFLAEDGGRTVRWGDDDLVVQLSGDQRATRVGDEVARFLVTLGSEVPQ
jgi:hypothetical protein